ncbi:MAG TPA: Lrp/AsnC family transcriptional regulator [Candidatus Bathyarchaeia archaeon]|nr:Lrp/AsnC family transcriptional regulator [Candidatus Bathyarchaeia archaeon]
MTTAYVLINCDHKSEVIREINQLQGILESAELDAVYDILVKLNLGTIEEIKETINGPLKQIPYIKSIVTLVATSG